MTSAVFILPAALREAGDVFGRQMGWGDTVYIVPLSASGEAPPTHFSCRADIADGFKALMASPPPEAAPLLAALVYDESETLWGREHFDAVLAREGLKQILPEG